MKQRPEPRDRAPSILLFSVLAVLIVSFLLPRAMAIPPRPVPRDAADEGSSATAQSVPSFPEWFGKGLGETKAVTGEGSVVTLLVEFPDRLADVSQRPASAYDDLFFSTGVVPTGSLREFYLEQSYGAFEVTGDVRGWYRTAEDYATNYNDGYFGLAYGSGLITDAAIDLADPYTDFGMYDSDGPDGIPNSGDDDGYVDVCVVVHAGAGGHDTMDPSDIWAHATSLMQDHLTNDVSAGGGFIRIGPYVMVPEVGVHVDGDSVLVGLGVVAHEYGHALGLPDLYDGSRETWGIGYWCLMSYGSSLLRGDEVRSPVHMSAWCKEQLGWVSPVVVTTNLWNVAIPPVETSPVVYKVWRDGLPGDEYFLLENRQNLGFDDILPGNGLLIWHIDQSTPPTYDLVDLEEADGRDDLEDGSGTRLGAGVYHPELGDAGDPYPGDSANTVFDEDSYPASTDNSGITTNVRIDDIQLDGNDVRLDIIITPAGSDVPSGRIPTALSLAQNCPNPFNPKTVIAYTLPEQAFVDVSIFDVGGKRVVTLEKGVRPAGPYELLWDGRDAHGNVVGSGVYMYRLKAGERLVSRKMVILK